MRCHQPGFSCRGTPSPQLLTTRLSLVKAPSCGYCSAGSSHHGEKTLHKPLKHYTTKTTFVTIQLRWGTTRIRLANLF